MNWINEQVSLIGSIMQVLLGYAAITGIVAAIVAAWVWVIGRMQFCLRETFWIVSWLAWKGWIWRKHRMSAKEYLRIAIDGDKRRAAKEGKP